MSSGLIHFVRCSSRLPCCNPNLPPVTSTSVSAISRCLPAKRAEVFLRRAASMTGSEAEFPELLPLRRREKKRRTVAGVDQEELLDPELLADPDSLFYDFNGVRIHHKICQDEEERDHPSHDVESNSGISESGTGGIGIPMILLHGFGASVFSWDQVMKPLARLTGSKVLAFDRPAFGLTSRVDYGPFSSRKMDAMPLNPYSMAFSVLASLSFLDLLGAEKMVLMGHSAGSFVAVNTYLEAPERVAALILVAPAIVAPFIQRNISKEKSTKKKSEMGETNSDARQNLTITIWRSLCMFFMGIAWLAMRAIKGIKDMVHFLYKKTVSTILRSTIAVMLVRIVFDKFGILAVRNAWFDSSRVTDHVIHGYTKPLKVKGWEMAILEYTLAILTDSESESKSPLTKRLSEISCPVLIVTGDRDRIVPAWNASRLSSSIPGSTLEVMKNCGHLPHEEKIEEFLAIVGKFLQGVARPSGEAPL